MRRGVLRLVLLCDIDSFCIVVAVLKQIARTITASANYINKDAGVRAVQKIWQSRGTGPGAVAPKAQMITSDGPVPQCQYSVNITLTEYW